jgi:hypothetical protein
MNPPKWWHTILAYWNALPAWVPAVVLAFLGAGYNYLDTIPTEQLLSALATWPGALALLKGAAVAGLGAVMLLVKQSFLPNVPSLTEIRAQRALRKVQQRGMVRLEPLALLAALSVAVAVGTLVLVASGGGCTPAQVAQDLDAAGLAAAAVLRDLALNKDLPAIEADVTAALADAGLVIQDVAAVVEDAINLLVDTGSLPPNLLARAGSIRAQAHAARKDVKP